MEMVIELKPCPFCGGKAEIKTDTRFPRYGKYADQAVTAYEVCCTNTECIIYNADNKYFLSAEEAVKAWNNRSHGWISVNDRLPKPEEQVIGCFEDGFIATVSTDANGEWELWTDSGEVTHWMPLPEPPEGGDRK